MKMKRMEDQQYVLDLVSAGGNPDDHSLCLCCAHKGMTTCPHDSQIKGLCGTYTFNRLPQQVVEQTILQYLQTPKQLILGLN